jgi:hypothetical protein
LRPDGEPARVGQLSLEDWRLRCLVQWKHPTSLYER